MRVGTMCIRMCMHSYSYIRVSHCAAYNVDGFMAACLARSYRAVNDAEVKCQTKKVERPALT